MTHKSRVQKLEKDSQKPGVMTWRQLMELDILPAGWAELLEGERVILRYPNGARVEVDPDEAQGMKAYGGGVSPDDWSET